MVVAPLKDKNRDVGAGWSGSFIGIGLSIQSVFLSTLGAGQCSACSSLLLQKMSSPTPAASLGGLNPAKAWPGSLSIEIFWVCAISQPPLSHDLFPLIRGQKLDPPDSHCEREKSLI